MSEIKISLQKNFPELVNVLCTYPIFDTKEFVIKSTKHFDSSHNWEHALAVALNAIEILKNDPNILCNVDSTSPRNIKMIFDVVFIAMLHDVCDHKYSESISVTELDACCKTISTESDMYMSIIDNISWSKEKKGSRQLFDDYWTTILNIVSDADRIEAIGHVGIERCIAFTIARGGTVPDDVITHYHEKLKLLYENGYIRTEYGKFLAKPRHDEMSQIINEMSNMQYSHI